jgi:hypothetical protein
VTRSTKHILSFIPHHCQQHRNKPIVPSPVRSEPSLAGNIAARHTATIFGEVASSRVVAHQCLIFVSIVTSANGPGLDVAEEKREATVSVLGDAISVKYYSPREISDSALCFGPHAHSVRISY